MPEIVPLPAGYAAWLAELKGRIHNAQQRAALAVNRELGLLYWQIGRDILARQGMEGWGAKVIERLAQGLRSAVSERGRLSNRLMDNFCDSNCASDCCTIQAMPRHAAYGSWWRVRSWGCIYHEPPFVHLAPRYALTPAKARRRMVIKEARAVVQVSPLLPAVEAALRHGARAESYRQSIGNTSAMTPCEDA